MSHNSPYDEGKDQVRDLEHPKPNREREDSTSGKRNELGQIKSTTHQPGSETAEMGLDRPHPGEGRRMDVGSAEEDGPEPNPVAGCGCSPMLPREARGISQVSQVSHRGVRIGLGSFPIPWFA